MPLHNRILSYTTSLSSLSEAGDFPVPDKWSSWAQPRNSPGSAQELPKPEGSLKREFVGTHNSYPRHSCLDLGKQAGYLPAQVRRSDDYIRVGKNKEPDLPALWSGRVMSIYGLINDDLFFRCLCFPGNREMQDSVFHSCLNCSYIGIIRQIKVTAETPTVSF
jgi:hypothetical protein